MIDFKKYIIGSVVLHFTILILATLIGSYYNSARKTFVILGAHSGKATTTRLNSKKTAIPFATKCHRNTSKKKNYSKKTTSRHSKKKPIAKKQKHNKQKSSSKKGKLKKQQHKKPTKQKTSSPPTPELSKDLMESKQKKLQKPIKSPPPPTEPELNEKKDDDIDKTQTSSDNNAQKQDDIQKQLPTQPQQNNINETEATNEEDESVFEVSGNLNDNDTLSLYHSQVQKEIARMWKPPIGVPVGTVCSILVTLNNEGLVEKSSYLERSNVLIYDLSIMHVIKQLKIVSLKNKSFKLVFKQ